MARAGTCRLEGCDKNVRGKGYCERHYRAWRKGKLPKARYKSCNTEGCTKPMTRRGLCETHFQSAFAKAKVTEGSPSETPA